jgi:hypothetical protein
VAIEREDIMGKNDSAKIGFFEKYLFCVNGNTIQ